LSRVPRRVASTVLRGPQHSNVLGLPDQALKSPKLHQKVSGYWHTTNTLARYCRVRSYLVTTRNHGLRPIDAIHAVLTGTTWLPTPAN
jgi:hypothetical protein